MNKRFADLERRLAALERQVVIPGPGPGPTIVLRKGDGLEADGGFTLTRHDGPRPGDADWQVETLYQGDTAYTATNRVTGTVIRSSSLEELRKVMNVLERADELEAERGDKGQG